jgi:hypothetical protein
MPILFRKSWRLGPRFAHVRFNASKTGVSRTYKVGPWSWNSRSRRQRVDLPGPFSWQGRTARRRTQAATAKREAS